MANRVEIPIVVLSDSSPTSPVSGATAVVKNRATETQATVYSDSGTTNNTITQPLSTDSTGKLTGWLPRGAYEVIITVPGKNPYTEYMDVAPGSDGAIDTAWIASNAVTSPKIAEDAIEGKHIKENAVGASEIIAGGVGSSELGFEVVETAKIKNGAVTPAKLTKPPVPGELDSLGNILVGSGFNASRKEEGVYEVKLTALAPTALIATANLIEQPGSVQTEHMTANESREGIRFHTFTSAGSKADRRFGFIIIPS